MRPAPESTDLLIIGGGASAVALLAALAKDGFKGAVLVAEKAPTAALGVAYATEVPHHILNVPAQVMGIDAEDPAGFLAWIKEKELSIEASDFASRITYGEYLQEIFERAIVRLGARVLNGEIVSLSRVEGGFVATSREGVTVGANRVVLAVGHAPLDLPIKNIVGNPGPGLVHNPWLKSGYDQLETLTRVGVIGTGLTAMDVVGALDKFNFRGEIVLTSRRGLLPFPSIGELPTKEFMLPAESQSFSLRALLRWVRVESKKLNAQGYDWRSVIDAFRPHTTTIWRNLSERERGQFLRHLKPYWEVVRHRMPNSVRNRIDILKGEGRLRIICGRVSKISSRSEAALEIEVSTRQGQRQIDVQRLFNCAGSSALKRSNLSPLLSSLTDTGLAVLDKFGLGVMTTTSGAIIARDGNCASDLYCIGPLRRAGDWESTAMREVREQAAKVSQMLTEI